MVVSDGRLSWCALAQAEAEPESISNAYEETKDSIKVSAVIDDESLIPHAKSEAINLNTNLLGVKPDNSRRRASSSMTENAIKRTFEFIEE